jgi:hypothetical protein
VSRWKQSLSRQLPAYMIPSEFVSLRHFPTTQNGKVDGQALDAMRLKAAALPPAPGPSPADAVEARLKAIWERLLKVKTVGIHDDFFALGGHSLLAARMLVQIEKVRLQAPSLRAGGTSDHPRVGNLPPPEPCRGNGRPW